MEQTDSGERETGPWRRRLVAAAGLVVFVGLLVPWRPMFLGARLDDSWMLGLHHAFARQFQVGVDWVFTYGPLGFLDATVYHPDTYGPLLAAWLFVAAALWYACEAAASNLLGGRGAARLAWMLLLAALMAQPGNGYSLALVATPAVLLFVYFHADRRATSARVVVLTITAALAALSKTSHLISSGLVVGVISVDQLLRRRIPLIALLFAAALLAFYLMAGQRPSGLGPYLANSRELIGGYAEAMGARPPTKQVDALMCACLIAVFVFAVWRRTAPSRAAPGTVSPTRTRRIAAALPTIGIAALLFLTFKSGYTRHDRGHATQATLTVLIYATLYLPVLLGREAAGAGPWIAASAAGNSEAATPQPAAFVRYRPLALPAMVAVGSVALAWLTVAVAARKQLPLMLLDTLAGLPRQYAAAARVVAGRAGYPQEYQANLARIRAAYPLPALNGSVDVYPTALAVAIAHGFEYRPRPVAQSYAAFTPALARLNAAHLAGPRPADQLLFCVESIDKRIPAMEDGLSWPQIFARYELAGHTPQFLILAKAQRTRDVRTDQRLSSGVMEFGTPFAVPQGQAVWATIDVRPTAIGKLVPVVFSDPPVLLDVTTRDGKTRTLRLVPAIARNGFLLSPLVERNETFAALSRGDWPATAPDAPVVSITLTTPGGGSGWAYRATADVSFYRFAVGR
jgi:hypothetical protein